MLTQAEIASMRATVSSSLPDTCLIETPTQVADGYGGTTESWATTYTALPCRLAQSATTPSETLVNGRVEEEDSLMLTLPYSTIVRDKDRVTISGNTYEVVAVAEIRSWELGKRVALKRFA